MRRPTVPLILLCTLAISASCGGGGKAARDAGSGTTTTETDAALPAECSLSPSTVTASRDGSEPAGSATYSVVSTAALPIPLVPNKDGAITDADMIARAGTTDLLGYVLFFGDEQFGPDAVSLFGGYAPTVAGKSRGAVSIFPNSATPLAAGDVLTPGPLDGLAMTTTLNRVVMDFKAAPDELTAYVGALDGSVRIVALTERVICLDVDLRWPYAGSDSTTAGTLTIAGTFAAVLAPRTLPFG